MGFFPLNWDERGRRRTPAARDLPREVRGCLPTHHAELVVSLRPIITRGALSLVWINPRPPRPTGEGAED